MTGWRVVVSVVIVSVFAVAAMAWLFGWFRASDPISHRLEVAGAGQPWGHDVDLAPSVFGIGTPRLVVEDTLRQAGYGRVRAALPGPFVGDDEVFEQRVERFPCSISRYVGVRYGEDDRLSVAHGATFERGCL